MQHHFCSFLFIFCYVALINHLDMKRAACMPLAKYTPRICPFLLWDVPRLSAVFVMDFYRDLLNRMERKTALMLSFCVRERDKIWEKGHERIIVLESENMGEMKVWDNCCNRTSALISHSVCISVASGFLRKEYSICRSQRQYSSARLPEAPGRALVISNT